MAEIVGADSATAYVVGADKLGSVQRIYIAQEEDGTSLFTLEEGGGFLLLERPSGLGGSVSGIDRAVAEVVT